MPVQPVSGTHPGSVADSGLAWGLGTDGTKAAQINPFVTLWWAVTGRSLGGDVAVDEIRNIRPVATIMDGNVVYGNL